MKTIQDMTEEFNKEIESLMKIQTEIKLEMKTVGSQRKSKEEASPIDCKTWKRASQMMKTA